MPKVTPKSGKAPAMRSISNILDKKPGGEEEILYPTPTLFDWDGKTYKIKPLSNQVLKTLADEFDEVTKLVTRVAAAVQLKALAEKGDDVDEEEFIEAMDAGAITPADFLPYIPEVLEILLPNATRIIADSLRVDEETVDDEMFLGKKFEALRLIIEANDFPLLFANFTSLTGLFAPPKAMTETNAEEDAVNDQDEETADPTDD